MIIHAFTHLFEKLKITPVSEKRHFPKFPHIFLPLKHLDGSPILMLIIRCHYINHVGEISMKGGVYRLSLFFSNGSSENVQEMWENLVFLEPVLLKAHLEGRRRSGLA